MSTPLIGQYGRAEERVQTSCAKLMQNKNEKPARDEKESPMVFGE